MTTKVKCGYVTFKNITWYYNSASRTGTAPTTTTGMMTSELRKYNSKTIEFQRPSVRYLVEKGKGSWYWQHYGTVYMPKKCDDWDDDDDGDDDDDDFDPDFFGNFILRLIPGFG